jgi:hypothetical protein
MVRMMVTRKQLQTQEEPRDFDTAMRCAVLEATITTCRHCNLTDGNDQHLGAHTQADHVYDQGAVDVCLNPK